MTAKKPSFAEQASAITDLVSHAKRCGHYGEPVLAWAAQAATTLTALAGIEQHLREFYAFARRSPDGVIELLRIARENPELLNLLTAFPGSRIVDVRRFDDENGDDA